MVDSKDVAAERSHEDAKAANALFQAAGQAIILINGGASTAILAFAAADKGVIRITAGALALSLVFFGVGVLTGALAIAFHGESVHQYMMHWEFHALGRTADEIKTPLKRGDHWGRAARWAFLISAASFMVGAGVLAFSLGTFKPSTEVL
jgi:hypothetical protein